MNGRKAKQQRRAAKAAGVAPMKASVLAHSVSGICRECSKRSLLDRANRLCGGCQRKIARGLRRAS